MAVGVPQNNALASYFSEYDVKRGAGTLEYRSHSRLKIAHIMIVMTTTSYLTPKTGYVSRLKVNLKSPHDSDV